MTGLRHSLVLHTLLHYKDPNIYIGHSSRSWASSLRCACLFCEVEPTLWAPKLSSIRASFAQCVLLICIFLGRCDFRVGVARTSSIARLVGSAKKRAIAEVGFCVFYMFYSLDTVAPVRFFAKGYRYG